MNGNNNNSKDMILAADKLGKYTQLDREDPQKIPWDEIAFRVIEDTLIQYFKDRPTGLFPFHIGNITKKLKVQPLST